MNIGNLGHLTYCTNIHPGESWQDTQAMLDLFLPQVKRLVSPDAPMGVGLRLSAQAAAALEKPQALQKFRAFLDEQGFYVFTINGFPYGSFHRQKVKDQVYLPNWLDEARLDYANRLADILAELLPEGITGSVSTVPGAYLDHLKEEQDREKIADTLIRHVAHLHFLHQKTGKQVVLALEPEPGCLLETSADAVDFFSRYLHSRSAALRLGELTGLTPEASQKIMRNYLGLCLDVCHLAVAFEHPAKAIAAIKNAGIAIHKIQLSAALKVINPGFRERNELLPFAEAVYLHQVAAKGPEGLSRWPDLSDALADPHAHEEWRIHFHVPLWAEKIGSFSTTIDAVQDILAIHKKTPLTEHLEIETYTWDVLGENHKKYDLPSSIAKEMEWVQERLA